MVYRGDLVVRGAPGEAGVDDAERKGVALAEAVDDDLIGVAQIGAEASGKGAVGIQDQAVGLRQADMDLSIRFSHESTPVPKYN